MAGRRGLPTNSLDAIRRLDGDVRVRLSGLHECSRPHSPRARPLLITADAGGNSGTRVIVQDRT